MYNLCWNLGTRSLKGKISEIVHWPSNWFWSTNVLLKGLQGLSTNQVNWNKTKAILKYFWHSIGICYVDKVFDSRKPGIHWLQKIIQVVEHWKKCSEPGYQLFKLFHCVDWLTMLVTLDSYLQLSGDHQPAVPLARDSEPESVRYGLDFRPSVV